MIQAAIRCHVVDCTSNMVFSLCRSPTAHIKRQGFIIENMQKLLRKTIHLHKMQMRTTMNSVSPC